MTSPMSQLLVVMEASLEMVVTAVVAVAAVAAETNCQTAATSHFIFALTTIASFYL